MRLPQPIGPALREIVTDATRPRNSDGPDKSEPSRAEDRGVRQDSESSAPIVSSGPALLHVRIYPILGFASVQANAADGWRAWTVARALDPEGSGVIGTDRLRAELAAYGVPDRSARRALRTAQRFDMLESVRGGERLRIAAPDRAALAFRAEIERLHAAEPPEALARRLSGAEQVGNPARLPARDLFGKGWRANLWAAFVAAQCRQPMSLQTASQLTGVPTRTLKRWSAQSRVRTRRNYAASDLAGDSVQGLRDHGRGSAFRGPDGRAWWRLPDTRQAPGTVRTVPRGRLRVINRKIRAALSKVGQGHASEIMRVFYPEVGAAERALTRRASPSAAAYAKRARCAPLALYDLWTPVGGLDKPR